MNALGTALAPEIFVTTPVCGLFFFFNDTATTEIYTLSLHDALPIFIHIASPSRFVGTSLVVHRGGYESIRHRPRCRRRSRSGSTFAQFLRRSSAMGGY